MPTATSSFPLRIIAIAGALVLLVGTLSYLVSGLGRPAGEMPPAEEPAPVAPITNGADTDPGEGGDGDPEAAAQPDAEAAPAQEAPTARRTTVTVQLFLADGSLRLTSAVRRVGAPITLAGKAHAALQQLRRSRGEGLQSPIPPGATVKEVWVATEDRMAYALVDAADAKAIATASRENSDALIVHLALSRPVRTLSDWLQ